MQAYVSTQHQNKCKPTFLLNIKTSASLRFYSTSKQEQAYVSTQHLNKGKPTYYVCLSSFPPQRSQTLCVNSRLVHIGTDSSTLARLIHLSTITEAVKNVKICCKIQIDQICQKYQLSRFQIFLI